MDIYKWRSGIVFGAIQGVEEIKIPMDESLVKLYDNFHQFVRESMRQIHLHDLYERDFKILFPNYISMLLCRASHIKYLIGNEPGGINLSFDEGTEFYGMKIYHGYEQKFIITHNQYPLFNGAGTFFFQEIPLLRNFNS